MSDGPARRVPVAKPSFGEEEERALVETLRSGWVTQGPRVAEFEQRFAAAVGAREAVAVSSCTAGLFLTLHAHGIGPGDEVVVPSLTFIASANAILQAGASPVFAEVDPRSYNLDIDAARSAVGPRTRAIMLVHQLGLPLDLEPFEAVAQEHGLLLVEDAACALGGRIRGRPVGSSPWPACFSFHPRKILVTGEGGMITTSDSELAARLRRLRHQGMSVSDLERHHAEHVVLEAYPELGFNFRMSDLHAAVGLAQLAKLDEFLARRRELAARYGEALERFPEVVAPAAPEHLEPTYQSYIVRLPGSGERGRNRVLDELQQRGVGSRRGLMACHLEPFYREARLSGSLAQTELAAAQTLLLPLFHGLTQEDQDYVLAALRDSLAAAEISA